MLNHDLNKHVNWVSTGLNPDNLIKIRQFYKYYKTHTLAKTAKRFRFSMKLAADWVAKIEDERSHSLLVDKNNRNFTTIQKLEIIKFARRYGFANTREHYGTSFGVQLRWIEQYKNNKLDFNPDIKLMKELSNDTQLAYTPLFLNKDKLIKALNVEDQVYGGIDIWTPAKMRYQAIGTSHQENIQAPPPK